MANETQVVEIFKCPNCGHRNYIEWRPGQASREVSCSNDYIEERKPQTMKNKDGNDMVVEQITNKGFSFTCTRGQGEQFVRREKDGTLGRDTSWVTTEEGVVDNG